MVSHPYLRLAVLSGAAVVLGFASAVCWFLFGADMDDMLDVL